MTSTMNNITRRQYNNRINKRRAWMIGIGVFFALLIFSIYFFSKTVTAERNTERVKLVASVEIQEGDTLWSIASDYITEEYSNIKDYIKEIKASNGLVSDTIHEGNYIIVPYYADAGL